MPTFTQSEKESQRGLMSKCVRWVVKVRQLLKLLSPPEKPLKRNKYVDKNGYSAILIIGN